MAACNNYTMHPVGSITKGGLEVEALAWILLLILLLREKQSLQSKLFVQDSTMTGM